MTRGEKIYTAFVIAFALLLTIATGVFLFLLIPTSEAPDRIVFVILTAVFAPIAVVLFATVAVNLAKRRLAAIPTTVQIVILMLTVWGIPVAVAGIFLLARRRRSEMPLSGEPERRAGVPSAELARQIPGLSWQQAEELSRLGPLREMYAPDPSSLRRNVMLLWAGIAIGMLALALVPIVLASPDPELAEIKWLLEVSFLFMAALFLPWCGRRLRQLARGARARILLHAEGMARFDRAGLLACRWDEIETVEATTVSYLVYFVRVGSRSVISVKFTHGRQIRIDEAKEPLANLGVLFQRISEESARYLLPRFLAATEAGETLSFGVFRLSKLGLHWGSHFFPWDDSKNLDFKEGLRIRHPEALLHPWWRLEDLEFAVPNCLVLSCLADHYIREQGRDLAPPREPEK